MIGVDSHRKNDWAEVTLFSILLLFFLQLLADFVGAVYAFGLSSTSMVGEVRTVVLLLAPAILLLLRDGLPSWFLTVVAEVMIVSRVTAPLLDTRGRMYVAGVGCACFLILLPSLLWKWSDNPSCRSQAALRWGIVLAAASCLSAFVLGSGADTTMMSGGQVIGWVLAGMAAILAIRIARMDTATLPAPGNVVCPAVGFPGVVTLTLGLFSSLVLIYFGFMSPSITTRWAEANYHFVTAVIMISLTGFAFVLSRPKLMALAQQRGILTAWNVVFVAAMVLTIWNGQLRLPADLGAYPIVAPAASLAGRVSLVVMLLTWPVLLMDFGAMAGALVERCPSHRALAGAFAIGCVYLLVMVFANIFTTVYDYIPVIGPFFRDRFWLVHLVPGVVLSISTLLIPEGTRSVADSRAGISLAGLAAVAALGVLAVVSSFVLAARPAPTGEKSSLRILSYNIQQGYSGDHVKNLEGQLRLMREADPDIIGLSECDTLRLSGANCDIVRYFADKLDMYSYYGPSPITGTFGDALLSRYPLENPTTFFMFSHAEGRREKEQTGAAQADITVGGKTFTVIATHLGNSGPLYQQEQVLGRLEGKENAILMGDFNFRPDTESYRFTVDRLVDSWVRMWDGNLEGREVEQGSRIDHIFLSPHLKVDDSLYITDPQSDHPAMLTQIGW